MAKTLQHRRDTTTNLASEAGAIGEFFMDTTKNTLVVMDGSTNGGHPLVTEAFLGEINRSVAPSSTYAYQLGTSSKRWSTVNTLNVDIVGQLYLNGSPGSTGYVATTNGSTASWSNLKTINGTSLLGSGDITVSGGGGGEFATIGTGNLYSSNLTNFATTRTTANECFLAGTNAGNAITSGGDNIAIGKNAFQTNTTGTRSIAIGNSALAASNFKTDNIAIGMSAMSVGYGGDGNIAIGTNALKTCNGDNNVVIGRQAQGTGSQVVGVNNIVLGYQAAMSVYTVNNEITLGNSSISALRCQVTSITSLSDARDKTDIEDLPAGLDFVNELRPVKFTWNMRDGAKVNEPDTGFIAQDLQSVQETTGVDIPGLVYDTNPEKLEAAYGKLIPVLVKSIQELTAKVNELENRLN